MIDRFKLLLEQLHLSPSEFADQIGVQRSSVSHVISGRNKPSIDFLEKILNVFPDIDVTWLITGRISYQMKSEIVRSKPELSLFPDQDGPVSEDENNKLQVLNKEEPVVQVIFVFKNGTFRILEKSEK
jgi:transcriptional regulator with XRE-family HTH domain